MAKKQLDEPLQISPEVAHRDIEGQLLLLLPDDSYLYTLNASGRLLWEWLTSGVSPSELAPRLRDHFGIETAQALKDVRAFLSQLKRKGILV